MGLSPAELSQVKGLPQEEVYKRISDYYKKFIMKWQAMPAGQQASYIFGNGRTGSPNYVNNSIQIIQALNDTPTLADTCIR